MIVSDGIREAIREVRQDTNLVDWALVTYDHSNGKPQSKTLKYALGTSFMSSAYVLRLVGTGEGGLAELKGQLAEDMVGYALYRTTERVDDSETVKFVFIDWRGPKIHRMQRAQLGTHSGALSRILHAFYARMMILFLLITVLT